ncbi:hypothetical protein DYB30_010088, partial [Aphanomyces astaci]
LSGGGVLIMISQLGSWFQLTLPSTSYPLETVVNLCRQIRDCNTNSVIVGGASIVVLSVMKYAKQHWIPAPKVSHLFESSRNIKCTRAGESLVSPTEEPDTPAQPPAWGFSLNDDDFVSLDEQAPAKPRTYSNKRRNVLLFLLRTCCDLGPLVVCLIGIVVGQFLGESEVKVIGHVPRGVPAPVLPWYGYATGIIQSVDFTTLTVHALSMALIVYMTSIAMTKRLALRDHSDVNSSQELIGLGMASALGAFFQVMPPTGGMSRTAVNMQVARTQLASIVTSLLVVLMLMVGMDALYFLPKASLAAVIIVAGFYLVEIHEATWLFHSKRDEFFVWLASFGATIGMGILPGLGVSILCSLVALMIQTKRPLVYALGRSRSSGAYVNTRENADAIVDADIVVVRVQGSLYFGNTDYAMQRILSLHHDQATAVVLDATYIHDMDATTLGGLEMLHMKLAQRGLSAQGILQDHHDDDDDDTAHRKKKDERKAAARKRKHERKSHAAVKIQAHVRGHQARTKHRRGPRLDHLTTSSLVVPVLQLSSTEQLVSPKSTRRLCHQESIPEAAERQSARHGGPSLDVLSPAALGQPTSARSQARLETAHYTLPPLLSARQPSALKIQATFRGHEGRMEAMRQREKVDATVRHEAEVEVAREDVTNHTTQIVTSRGQVRVLVMTWNLQAQKPPADLTLLLRPGSCHIYAIGTEECSKKEWEDQLKDTLGATYVKLRSHALTAMHNVVFVHTSILPLVSELHSDAIATGLGNQLGNKGGVGIGFMLGRTSFAFVGCHFEAHQSQQALTRRNANFHKVNSELQLVAPSDEHRKGPIASTFDRVFWSGDLNYRIDGTRKMIDDLLARNFHDVTSLHVLVVNDQLRKEMAAGRVFQAAIALLAYESHMDVKTSDHRPVTAIFDVEFVCDVNGLDKATHADQTKSEVCAVQ